MNSWPSSLVMTHEAFLTLVIPLQRKLFRFVYHYLRNEEEAKDVVQDAIVKLWEKRDLLNTVVNLEAWCIKVAKNVMLDRAKYNSYRTTQYLHPHKESSIEKREEGIQKVEMNDTVNSIQKMIDRLPEKYKLYIVLRDMEGYAYQEIAEIMAVNLSDVKIGIFRARQAIRRELQNLESYGLH